MEMSKPLFTPLPAILKCLFLKAAAGLSGLAGVPYANLQQSTVYAK